MAVRRHLLPEGYSAKQRDGIWYLVDPRGVYVMLSDDGMAIELHAWRHLWRTRHEDFIDDLDAFRAGPRVPGAAHGIADALPARQKRPDGVTRIRWQGVAAAAAAAAVAALVIGLAGMEPLLENLGPLPSPNQGVASISARPKLSETVRELAGVPEIARVVRMARPRPKARYAVSAGNYANPAAADRMKHLVRSKGYIVDVVRHGAVSQVVTPPFWTRVEAENVARGFAEIRLPAQLVVRLSM
jgi:hypothetical protein